MSDIYRENLKEEKRQVLLPGDKVIRSIREEKIFKHTMNKVNNGIHELFDKEEEGIMESVKDIISEVQEIRK